MLFNIERRMGPREGKNNGIYSELEFHGSMHNAADAWARRKNPQPRTLSGNVALVDGSAHLMTGDQVREAIASCTNDHRLLFPFVPGKNW